MPIRTLLIVCLALAACGREPLYASSEAPPERPPSVPDGTDPGTPDTPGPIDPTDTTDPTDPSDPAAPDDPANSDDPTDPTDPVEVPRAFSEPTAIGSADQVLLAGFSPDGRWLAWLDAGAGIADAVLHVVDTGTGQSTQVATSVAVITGRPVHFSPDSRYVSFRTSDGERASIDSGPLHLYRLGGEGPGLRLGDGVQRQSFRFTPDGQRLVFASYSGLFVHDVGSGATTQIAASARFSPYVEVESVLPVSQDGRYLAYDARGELHVYDFERGTDVILSGDLRQLSARFSDAGDRIAWVDRTWPQQRLHIHTLFDGAEQASPEGSGFVLSPAWDRVAYLQGAVQQDGYRDAQLRVTHLADGVTHTVGDGVDPFHYKFAPDGRSVVFLRGREESYAYTGELHLWDGARSRLLDASVFTNWENLASVEFSPDGAWLVYQPATSYPERQTVVRQLATDATVELGDCVDFFSEGIAGFGALHRTAHCALFLPAGEVVYGEGTGEERALMRGSLRSDTPHLLARRASAPPRVSPAGQLLATLSFRSDRSLRDLVVTDLGTGLVQTLVASGRVQTALAADDAVAFVTQAQGRTQTVWLSLYR